jgi:hypothetical protein
MEKQEKKKLLVTALSGLLGLGITIFSSLLVDYCTSKKSSLHYYAKLSDAFEKDSLQLRTCSLELQNDGDGMLEDIKGMVQFEGQHIMAYKLKGSPTLSITDSLVSNTYWLRLASLNPMEKLALNFLLSGSPTANKPPLIDFRARGISAVGDGGRPLPVNALFVLLGLVTAYLANLFITRFHTLHHHQPMHP